jgi:hypothetical protein
VEISVIKIKNVDFNTIKTILVKGLNTIQDIRGEWGNMIRFFQTISSLIKMNLHSYIEDLVVLQLSTRSFRFCSISFCSVFGFKAINRGKLLMLPIKYFSDIST